jgi:hypothetical protein
MVKKHTYVYYRYLQIYHRYSVRVESSRDKMKIAFLRFPRACNRNACWRDGRLPPRKGHIIVRSITLKAALAALIVTVPLSGAFAANGNGGTGGNSHGDNGGRGSDGIDSFHQYPTPLGVRHYGSPYNRSDNRPNAESTPRDPISEGLREILGGYN